MRIESKAPTRIDLAGGTLDIWPLYLFHEGAVTVNCAITRYASCVIETDFSRAILPSSGQASRARTRPEKSERIVLVSRDTKREESFPSLEALCRARRYKLPLLAHLVRVFRPSMGLHADHRFRGSRWSGDRWLVRHGRGDLRGARSSDRSGPAPRRLDSHQPRRRGHRHPRAHRHAGSLPSGIRRRRRHRSRAGRRTARGARLRPRRTGTPIGALLYRQAAAIRHQQLGSFKRHIDGDRRVAQNLEKIAVVARQVRAALERNQWNEVGRLVREEWEFRRRNLRTISTPVIDRIISSARRQGALGGKVCGAGGGGCLTLVIEPEARARVEAAVTAAGGTLLPLRIDRDGVQVRSDGQD